MLFSTDKLYKQENIIDNAPIKKMTTMVDETTSIFVNALRLILDENILIENELNKYTIPTFKNRDKMLLNEAENSFASDQINIPIGSKVKISLKRSDGPSFWEKVKTNFSLENIIKFIIKAFSTILTKIWRQFQVICMNLVSKSSQIRRLKSKIYSLGVNVPYEKPMFEYTHIIDSPNRTDLQEELDKIYNEILTFMSKTSKLRNNVEIDNAINEFRLNANTDEDFFAESRGNLLGMQPISADTFNEELFKYFRNGSSIATTGNNITPDKMRNILNNWELANNQKLIKGYERDKAKLEKAGNSLASKIEASKFDYQLQEVPANTLDLYSEIVNRYAHKIKNICNIFVIYYSHKLDAAKDELAMNTSILFEAAKFIVKEGL